MGKVILVVGLVSFCVAVAFHGVTWHVTGWWRVSDLPDSLLMLLFLAGKGTALALAVWVLVVRFRTRSTVLDTRSAVIGGLLSAMVPLIAFLDPILPLAAHFLRGGTL